MAKKIKCHTALLDTALHVVKGAVAKVFDAPLTISVSYRNAKQARLVVAYSSPTAPTNEQIKQVEKLTNEIIQKNIQIKEQQVKTEEAESTFGNVVAGVSLFDKMIPKVDDVNVILIENWNVNCCAGPHLANTSEIGALTISRVNHRPQKEECEFVVEISSGNDPKAAKKKKWETKKKPTKEEEPVVKQATAAQLRKASSVNGVAEEILQMVINECGTLDTEKAEQIKKSLAPQIKQKLTVLKNTAYAEGFAANNATQF